MKNSSIKVIFKEIIEKGNINFGNYNLHMNMVLGSMGRMGKRRSQQKRSKTFGSKE